MMDPTLMKSQSTVFLKTQHSALSSVSFGLPMHNCTSVQSMEPDKHEPLTKLDIDPDLDDFISIRIIGIGRAGLGVHFVTPTSLK